MIFVIDDDKIMAECVKRAIRQVAPKQTVQIFANAIEATAALNDALPDLIFLDILLDGPNGFTFLNELASYSDTAKIPIVLISSLDLRGKDLSDYGVVGILDKNTMTPQDVQDFVRSLHEK